MTKKPREVVRDESGRVIKAECMSCHAILGPEMFSPVKGGKTGLHSYCKPCKNERYCAPGGQKKQAPAARVIWSEDGGTVVSKECAACREMLPASSFAVDKTRKLGLYSYCKPCQNAKKRESTESVKQRGELVGGDSEPDWGEVYDWDEMLDGWFRSGWTGNADLFDGNKSSSRERKQHSWASGHIRT
jgi:hypothetical protein